MGGGDLGLGILLEARDLFSGGFQRAGMAFKEFEGTTTEGANRIKDSLKGLTLGVGLFTAGIAGLALLRPATEAFSDFSNRVSEISTLTDEASLNTMFLGEQVMGLNAAYGGGIAQEAKALYDGISAGASNAAQAQALLLSSNRLAVAGRAEVGVALDGLTSSLNAYGTSFERAGEFSDAMFTAVRKGKTTITELAAVIGRVAPTAASLDISFDQLTASVAAMTTKGLRTEEAVTGLKAALANIIRPTSDAVAEAGRLGIKFTATSLRALGLKGFLDQITGSAKFNADSMAKLFGSVEGLNAVLALTANGSATFADALDAVAKKTGATDKAFAKMSEEPAFIAKQLDGLKDNAKILIGEALEPLEVATLRFGKAVLETFNNMPDSLRTFLVQAFALTSVLLTVVGAGLGLKAGLGILSAGLEAAGVTAAGLSAALWPVVLTIAAVGLAVEGFRIAYETNLGGFADFINGLGAKIKLAWDAIGQAFDDGGFSGSVRDELNRAENGGLKNFIVRLFVTVERIKAFLGEISGGIQSVFAGAEPSFVALGAAVQRIGDIFSALWETLDPTDASATFDAFVAGGGVVGRVLGHVAVLATDLFTVVLDLISGILPVLRPIGALVGALIDVFVELFGELGDIAEELGLLNSAVDGSAGGWVEFGNEIATVIGFAADVIKSFVITIGGVLKGAFNILGGIADIFTGNLERGIGRVLYGIAKLIGEVVLGSIDVVAKASDALLGTKWSASITSWREGFEKSIHSAFLPDHAKATGEAPGTGYATATGSVVEAPGGGAQATPAALPAASLVEANATQAPDFTGLYASVDALKDAKEGPMNLSLKVSLDGADLRSRIESADRDEADRSFASGIPIAQ